MNARTKKLQLRKESIRTLGENELANVGGGAETVGGSVVVLNTVVSVCRVCYPKPIFTSKITWPVIIGG